MTDREKVIKGLMVCIDRIPGKYNCNECPYEIDGNDCDLNMAKDALSLLKEQPDIVRCKDCRYGQYCTYRETTYQCFKRNSNEFGALHKQDWFCADGERE